ncbi:MAG: GH32 C-terminal domain-containing protein [Gemmatimonadota bacterium]
MADRAAAPGSPAFPLTDKTLVAWVWVGDLAQRGAGSVLTLEKPGGVFDGLVYAEIAAARWMAGSDSFRRTCQDQAGWPAETAGPEELVQIAAAYLGGQVTLYRNGREYARYEMASAPVEFGPDCTALMGPRHVDAFHSHFRGAVADARIYPQALSAGQIASLRPHEASDPSPLAWWDFGSGAAADRTGTFGEAALVGEARLDGGRLVLPGRGSALVAAPAGQERAAQIRRLRDTLVSGKLVEASRQLRHRLLQDRHRPAYHFAIPEGCAMPFDPNGCIHWNGRYHLGYIYQEEGVHFWGHVSSLDLLHWRHHSPWLYPTADSPETGIFSGNCFVNRDGEATMLYHGCGAGNCVATSAHPDLEHFAKLPANPIVPIPAEGTPEHALYRSWDPHGWLEGDTYYGIFGGQRPAIFRARQLDQWEYVGDLLAHAAPGVDIREDISCPDLFELGGRHVLVCISHRLGCRYYVGDWRDEQFHPERHELMSWVDNAYFAPETMLDHRGRRLLWTWIFDGRDPLARQPSGWSGTMGLPRVLTLGGDGWLRMEPVEELERLRYDERPIRGMDLAAGADKELPEVRGDVLELAVEMRPDGARQCGAVVCRSPGGEEQTRVYYDAHEGKLKIDARQSSRVQGPRNIEAGPFRLEAGEALRLRIYVDRSVVEVFANGRQAVMRRVYPSREDSLGVSLFSAGGSTRVLGGAAWDLMPTNPY